MAEMIVNQLFLLMVTDLNTNLVIVKDGRISPLLRSPQFSKVWPTIRADINDLELKFLSPRRVSRIGQLSCVIVFSCLLQYGKTSDWLCCIQLFHPSDGGDSVASSNRFPTSL